MKPSLRIGTSGTLATRVGPGQTITLGDNREATVFSTPSMIHLMELAAREALRPNLDPGEESVGVDVQITHTSATPPRTQVTAEAIVTSIDKNVVSFDVVSRDPWGEIGRGTHRRAIIDTSKFAIRLAQQKQSPPEISGDLDRVPKSRFIECKLSDGLLRLTLNRAQKRNAINAEMTGDLERIVAWLDHPDSAVRVVIVSGSQDTFCAGDDVGELSQELANARELSLRRGELYSRMTELPQPFIAAIDGLALGGGFVLAAACDYRIATHRARFGLPEVSLGWPPNYGMGIVQSVIGRGRTIELALSGETIDARRAKSIGLIREVVAPVALSSMVTQLAQRLLSISPTALGATKRLLTHTSAWSDEAASNEFANCLASEAAKKSIERFR